MRCFRSRLHRDGWQLELALRAREISPGDAVAISGARKSRGQERKRFDWEP